MSIKVEVGAYVKTNVVVSPSTLYIVTIRTCLSNSTQPMGSWCESREGILKVSLDTGNRSLL